MENNEKLMKENDVSAADATIVDAESQYKRVKDVDNSKLDLKKLKELIRYLKSDLLGADAKWSLFIAACQSYRIDSCLKPFPPMFIKEEKDICSLLAVTDKTPSFVLLQKYLDLPDKYKPNPDVVNLVHWVLMHLKEPTLRTIPKDQFDNVLSKVPSQTHATKPDHIFEMIYSEKSVVNLKWNQYKEQYPGPSFFGYHGSRLENFHSIINYGLQISMTKNSLFGQGVYLSSELLVSLPYSPTGFSWGKSTMGEELSVVALCEIVDHPSTHCQTKTGNKARAMASDSIAGEVPHKYYVVSNSENIRIRYLLIYARSPPAAAAATLERAGKNCVVSWIQDHKLLTAIASYVVLLASVGLSNNHKFLRYCRIVLNKVGIDY